MKKTKTLFKILFITVILIYVAYTFITQQKTINQYAENCKKLDTQIAEQKDYKEDLTKQKENTESEEFIETTAREKVDMYLPNATFIFYQQIKVTIRLIIPRIFITQINNKKISNIKLIHNKIRFL